MASISALSLILGVVLINEATNAVHANSAGIEVSRLFATKDVRRPLAVTGEGNNGTGCGCVGYNCGCCAHLDVEKIGLNDTVCTNLTYLPDQYGVSLTISVDGVVYYNNTISARNPPPICAAVPYLKKYASLCIQFYNLDVQKTQFSGCIRVVARLAHLIVDTIELGCFKIPPGGKTLKPINVHHTELLDIRRQMAATRDSEEGTGCRCVGNDCGCWAYLKVEEIGLNDTACVNMTYLPDQLGMSLTINVDGSTYYNYTISAKNPPPICAAIPFLKKLASLCVKFYNLDWKQSQFSGCVRIEAELEYVIVDKIDLGCFKIPLGEQSMPKKYVNTEKQDMKQLETSHTDSEEGTGCGCVGNDCGCCAYLQVEEIGLNDTVCANVTYLPDQYGVSLTISVDGVVYYNNTISAKNPPPICAKVPFLKQFSGLCVQFYDLDWKLSNFSGCVRLVIKLEHLVINKFKLGCFKIPLEEQEMSIKDVPHTKLQVVNMVARTIPATNYKTTGCSCLYYDCGCCMDLAVGSRLAVAADTVCANMTFLVKTSEVSLTLSVDKVTYFNKTIPVRNPPPVCFHIPYLTSMDLCVQFYSLDIKDAKLTGCLRFLSEIDGKVVESFDLGCFKFPAAVGQKASDSLHAEEGRYSSQFKDLLFLAYKEAKKQNVFDNL